MNVASATIVGLLFAYLKFNDYYTINHYIGITKQEIILEDTVDKVTLTKGTLVICEGTENSENYTVKTVDKTTGKTVVVEVPKTELNNNLDMYYADFKKQPVDGVAYIMKNENANDVLEKDYAVCVRIRKTPNSESIDNTCGFIEPGGCLLITDEKVGDFVGCLYYNGEGFSNGYVDAKLIDLIQIDTNFETEPKISSFSEGDLNGLDSNLGLSDTTGEFSYEMY